MTGGDYLKQFPDAAIASELRRARMRREGGKNLLPHWEPIYSEEYMMDRTYRYHRMGHRLRTTWVCEHDHNLWQQVHRQGITWESFVTGLGIPYTHDLPPRPPRLTREAVLEGLRQVAREEGTTPRITHLAKRHHPLMTGVGRHFGSYDEALEAAGLPRPPGPSHRRREFSAEAVFEELRQLAADGHPVTARGIRSTLDRRDLHHAIERMGGYPAVRKELGIAKPPLRRAKPRHTREEVIATFQNQAAQGKPFTIKGMKRGSDADRTLLRSARYHFENWPRLMEAAGLIPEHHAISRARDRREGLLEQVRHRHQAGGPLDRQAMRREEESKALYRKCSSAFGNWEKTLAAAGLPVEMADKEIPIRKEILAEIRELQQTGQPLTSRAMIYTPAGRAVYNRAKAAFRNWKNAVLAAGFEWPQTNDSAWIEKHRPVKAARRTSPARQLRSTAREEREKAVIEAIRERQRLGKTLRLRWIRRESEGKELYDTARRVFTSWKTALKAAGCKPETPRPRKISRIARELELAYPIDPAMWESPPAKTGEKTASARNEAREIPLRGWRQPGKGEKQRTTASRAKRRGKRK